MPEYLSPGVYVEEIEIGAKPIEGVSTSTVGFVGKAEKGFAALYYPWVKARVETLTNGKINMIEQFVPPSGYIAGIYARIDAERGGHKAPANEIVQGILEIQTPISKGEQDVLNPNGINCIRAFAGRGIRVWGARTTASDGLWKYVNVRRLFLYIEESIDEGTRWVVFEPNGERLWGRVRATITEFLTRVWRDGALIGTKPEEALSASSRLAARCNSLEKERGAPCGLY